MSIHVHSENRQRSNRREKKSKERRKQLSSAASRNWCSISLCTTARPISADTKLVRESVDRPPDRQRERTTERNEAAQQLKIKYKTERHQPDSMAQSVAYSGTGRDDTKNRNPSRRRRRKYRRQQWVSVPDTRRSRWETERKIEFRERRKKNISTVENKWGSENCRQWFRVR